MCDIDYARDSANAEMVAPYGKWICHLYLGFFYRSSRRLARTDFRPEVASIRKRNSGGAPYSPLATLASLVGLSAPSATHRRYFALALSASGVSISQVAYFVTNQAFTIAFDIAAPSELVRSTSVAHPGRRHISYVLQVVSMLYISIALGCIDVAHQFLRGGGRRAKFPGRPIRGYRTPFACDGRCRFLPTIGFGVRENVFRQSARFA